MSNDILDNPTDLEAWNLKIQLENAMNEQRFDLALPLAERLYEIQEARYGIHDDKTLEILDCLVASWMYLAQWSAAESFLLPRYGEKNQKYVHVVLGWAIQLLTKKDLDGAEDRGLRALTLAREAYGPEDQIVAICHSLLADVARQRKSWDDALMHATQAFQLRSKSALKMPELVYQDLILIADVFMNIQEYDEACKTLRSAVELAAGALNDDPRKMATALFLYGRAAMADKKPENAVNPFRGALDYYEKLYGPEDARLGDPLYELGNAYQAAEYFEEAEETFQRLLHIYEVFYADKKTMKAIALVQLGDLATKQNEYARASTHYEEALALAVEEFGSESFRLFVILDKAAEARLAEGNLDRAEELSKWQIRVAESEAKGPDDPAFLASARRLAQVEMQRLKENRANEAELGRRLEWVTKLMAATVEQLQAETKEIESRAESHSKPS